MISHLSQIKMDIDIKHKPEIVGEIKLETIQEDNQREPSSLIISENEIDNFLKKKQLDQFINVQTQDVLPKLDDQNETIYTPPGFGKAKW